MTLQPVTVELYKAESFPSLYNAPEFESDEELTQYYLETFSPQDLNQLDDA